MIFNLFLNVGEPGQRVKELRSTGHRLPGFKGLLVNTGKSRDSCSDNDGLIVDTAVGMLRRAGREDELDLVMLHYMYNVSKSTIARWQKCSEGKIRNKLMIAETFIDACIIMTGTRLEMDDWTHKCETGKVA